MCEEHPFVAPDNLDEELTEMLKNQTEDWNTLKEQLDSSIEVQMNSPPPQCASELNSFENLSKSVFT